MAHGSLGGGRLVPSRRRRATLLGRQPERAVLDQVLEAINAGESRALVVRGEAGIGKSALLADLRDRAVGCRVVMATGVQAEMELPFAALHQLCVPMLDLLDSLPEPQRDALHTVFGIRQGLVPDRFLVGLAVLGLLAAAAEDRPLVCLIDDEQWLDRESMQVLAFVARRLFAESVACVFAIRTFTAADELTGLPAMELAGLPDRDARSLLHSVVPGRLDDQVANRIIAEARGNPLALQELPRGLTPAELAGVGSPAVSTPAVARPLPGRLDGRLEDSFQQQLAGLPEDTRQLLLLAAAEPLGDPTLLWRAAARLGDGIGMAAGAAAGDLIVFGAQVRFRHPLVRSAVYRAASPEELRRVHQALAEAIDADVDPDRRAWHRAQATARPDEDVAAELERSAGRAQARGGLIAAATFLERAAALTPDPGRRAARALAAARAKHLAGLSEEALALLASAQAGPLDELQLAHAELLHAEIAFATNRGNLAAPMLVKVARQLEPLDPGLAREAYLQAMSAAIFAGRLAIDGGRVLEIAAAVRAAPPAVAAIPRAVDLLFDALVLHLTADGPTAAPVMRRAMAAVASSDASAQDQLQWLWLAAFTAAGLWDQDSLRLLAERYVQLARQTGALAMLPLALSNRINVCLLTGELAEAELLSEEVHTIVESTRLQILPYGAVQTAGWLGRQAEFERLAREVEDAAMTRGEGLGLTVCDWARAVLYNGLGRYEDARAAAERACADPGSLAGDCWAPIELVEAAVRCGDDELAARALEQLTRTTQPSDSDFGRGIEARTRALVSEGAQAESYYQEAIDRFGRTRLPKELARAHLLYGEWLRRDRRRGEARRHLRTAHEMFSSMGAEAFADRAARELHATGETARKRSDETKSLLTPREVQVARLAAEGLTNPEIGTQLFLSPRTVEYHLRHVFTKTGITSRTALATVLPQPPGAGGSTPRN